MRFIFFIDMQSRNDFSFFPHDNVAVFKPHVFPNLINMSENAIIRTRLKYSVTRIDGGNSERFHANNT